MESAYDNIVDQGHIEEMEDGNVLVFSPKTCGITLISKKESHLFFNQQYSLLSESAINSLARNFLPPKHANKQSNRELKTHLDLTVFTTLDCNSSCQYCFESGLEQKGRITSETINSILELVDDKKPKSLAICFHGGEPFLVPEAIEEISQRIDKRVECVHKTVVTNGTLFSSHTVQTIARSGLNRALVTIDGDKKSHDRARPLKSGNSSFEAIMSGLARLLSSSARLTVDVATNVSPDSPDLIEKTALTLNPFRELISHVIPSSVSNYGQGLALSTYSSEEWAERECKAVFHVVDNGYKSLSPFMKQACSRRHPDSYVFSPTGLSHGCIALIGRDCPIRRTSENNHAACKYFPICNGGCPANSDDRCLKDYFQSALSVYLPMLYERVKAKKVVIQGDTLVPV